VTYAADTKVSVDKSILELRRTVARYGATGFAMAEDAGRAAVVFAMRNRRVRITVTMPPVGNFARTPTNRLRDPSAQRTEWEKACRQRWRALNLIVKAKLEAVEAGITTFDEEFLAYLMLPAGQTVGEELTADGRLDNALTDVAASPLLALPAARTDPNGGP
jgi:hypothetical protein